MPTELPPQVTAGKYLVVRDVYGDEKVIEIPSGRRVLIWDGTDVRFVTGAEGDPFILPDLDKINGGELPYILAMTAAGQMVAFKKPDEDAGLHTLVNEAGAIGWRRLDTNTIPEEGTGLVFQDADGNIILIGGPTAKGLLYFDGAGGVSIIETGTDGTFLKMVSGVPAFGGLPTGSTSAGGSVSLSLTGIRSYNSTSGIVNITTPSVVAEDSLGNTITLATVNVNVNIAAPVGEGGIDTGALALGTWYHLYIISDGTNVAGIFSLDANAPDLSATTGPYTYWTYAGVFYVEGGGAIRDYLQIDREFWYKGNALLGDTMSYTTAFAPMVGSVSLASLIPPNVKAVTGFLGGGSAEGVARSSQVASNAAGTLAVKILGGAAKDFTSFGGFRFDYDVFHNQPIETPGSPQLYWKGKVAATGKRRVEIGSFRI